MKHSFATLLAAGATLIVAGCSDNKSWRLNGDTAEGVGTVYIEAPTTSGGWHTLDSASVADGKYSFNLPAANGTIYRLRLGDRTVYLPADSTETLTLDASGRRGGSAEALLFNAVDSAVSAGADGRGVLGSLDGQYASTAAYYATRIMRDRTLLRTVANRYKEEHPADPRTSVLLADFGRMNSSAANTAAETDPQIIYAPQISYFDIELMDREGKMRKLSETVENSPVAILAYVDLASADASAITRALGDARNSGASIFEVGFHENQHLWAAATEGLPWVNVYQSEAANDTHMGQYRVTALPMFFILRDGEITERITDYTKLPK